MKINKKEYYEFILQYNLDDEEYENCAKIRDFINTLNDEEYIEIDDEEFLIKNN